MFRYPWTNLHELNLNWIIQQVRDGLVDHGCVFVRPEDFPDSENPIQDAMDAAERDNKMVLLSGAYSINTTLVPPENTVIIGIENATISTVKDEGLGYAPVTILNCTSGLYVRGVTFDGNRPAGPSQSTYPSLHPGELVNVNPLVMCWEDVDGVTFEDCTWFNFDSNRSTSNTSALYAALGCYMASNITVRGCYFKDIRLECTVFDQCEDVRIVDSNFDCGNEAGVYSDIGLLRTNDAIIDGCVIHHGEDLTTSTINAMGDHIVIDRCYVVAPGSTHGIDYGNEIGSAFTADDLIIRNSYINCHIDAAAAYPVNHDNIVIENCTISGENIALQSGVVIVAGNTGQRFTIRNNKFVGPMGHPTHAIIMDYTSVLLDISGNTFEVPGLRIKGTVAGMTVKDNLFEQEAIFQALAGADPQVLSLIGCRTLANIGRAVSSNNISIVAVGCDLANATMTNTTVDATLSYVRS